MKKGIVEKCALLPVQSVATALGLATLSNVWANPAVGFPGVRYVSMAIAALVLLAALLKILVHFKTFKADYFLPIPTALYATVSMLTMVLGGFLVEYVRLAGQIIWFTGVLLHAVHLCIFTYRFVLKGIKIDTVLPTWFVTYMGFMTAVVSGMPMGFPVILDIIMIYGYIVYPIILVGMLVRIAKKPLPGVVKPTGAIFLAPSSLFFISFLNVGIGQVYDNIGNIIAIGVYIIVFITIIRVATLVPGYIRGPFSPGMAALTFPSAIALVATMRMIGYLNSIGLEQIAVWLRHFFGVQIFITTAIMAYIGYNFLLQFFGSYRQSKGSAASADYNTAKLD